MNETVTGKERWTGIFCLAVPHAWWPRCGSPMLCSDGPPLLDGCRWLRFVLLVVVCVEPWVRLSFSFSLLLLSLALLFLVRPAAYPTCFCLLPRVVRSLLSLRRSTHQGFLLSFLLHVCVLLSVSSVSCCLPW
uniref:Uncharacterized protein n=1 Tax=Triticum urartu TaxID=4572 RepID=A0A8R7NZD2_TRIUA